MRVVLYEHIALLKDTEQKVVRGKINEVSLEVIADELGRSQHAIECIYSRAVKCQTAHCGRGKSHFIFGGLASPIVPYRNLTQTTDGITADCRSLV